MMTETRNIFPSGNDEPATSTGGISPETVPKHTPLHNLGSNVCSKLVVMKHAIQNANLTQMTTKIDELKTWTVSKYKTTKQNVLEQLGKVDRTHDKEIEDKIEGLRDMHRRYQELLSSAKALTNYFALENNMKKSMAEAFYQLGLKEEPLKTEFNSQCDTMRNISHNGELLHKALTYMISSLETLCEKTIEDTLITVQMHEQARLEYDVYRHELILLKQNPNTATKDVTDSEEKCKEAKEKYERLKDDVRVLRKQMMLLNSALTAYHSETLKELESSVDQSTTNDKKETFEAKVKMTLLNENRLKVMRKQMSLFHSALTAYYSGNLKSLQSSVDQFSLDDDQSALHPKRDTQSPSNPSFLEQ